MVDQDFDDFFYINETQFSDEEKAHSCFFTGHRNISAAVKPQLIAKMKSTVSYLYSKGVNVFHTGGALGFDTLAAVHIVDLKREHPEMKLILDLPYLNQTEFWNDTFKRYYGFLMSNADMVNYVYKSNVSNKESARKYLLMRNRIMADTSKYCICYHNGSSRSGTGYTVSYARRIGCEITNLYN